MPVTNLPKFTRRLVLGGILGSAACRQISVSSAEAAAYLPLRQGALVPVGCCIKTGDFADPAFVTQFTSNFSQLTPEWEMKMASILKSDGTYKFEAADAVAAFAQRNKMRLHATTLVWYKQRPTAFVRLDGQREAFAAAYRDYILTVVRRYKGRAVGWDVVNEPIESDGKRLRECLWSKNMGAENYMVRAFQHATEADPNMTAFINEYALERDPTKRLTFMKLIERLLKKGAKIGGIGTQTHLRIEQKKGASAAAIKDLASFGLPIHISELDVSFGQTPLDRLPLKTKLAMAAEQAAEVSEAFMALPEKQRYALTLWGLNDGVSWLRQPPYDPRRKDQPLAFDDYGKPNPMFDAIADAIRKPGRTIRGRT